MEDGMAAAFWCGYLKKKGDRRNILSGFVRKKKGEGKRGRFLSARGKK